MWDAVQFENIPSISETLSKRERKRYRVLGWFPCHGRRTTIMAALLVAMVLTVAVILLVLLLRRKEHWVQDDKQTSPQIEVVRRPNVVFVLADDLGYDDVSYHGSTQIKTPNLDALCRDGVQLENYYVQPTCTPTRSQLLTGRYQIHLGLSHGNVKPCQAKGVPLDETLLPQKLKEVGYRTHMVGKWHVGHYREELLPHNRGFDTYYGMLLGADDHFSHTRSHTTVNDQGEPITKSYVDLWENDQPIRNETGHYSTHLFTQKAIDVINSQTQDQPFFLYVAYQAVHGPLQVTREFYDMYPDISDQHRRLLAGMVSAVDEGVGNLTEALKSRGLWENTVLIFSTDNGSHQPSNYNNGRNWPLRGGKATLFEGGIRAVGFVNGGLIDRRGVVSRELMHVSDWFPTIAHGLAGADIGGTKPLDGFDQWKTISANRPSPRKTILHNINILAQRVGTPAYEDTFDTRVRAALRVGEMKLMTGNVGGYRNWIPPPDGETYNIPANTDPPDKNLWLFNLTSDPYETTDLSPYMPDLVRSMLDLLDEFNKTAITPSNPIDDPRCDPGLRDGVWGPWLER